jgi:hypothetical protein
MLGHLGAFLARQGAHQIQIADEGDFLSASWLPAGSARRQGCFRASELDQVSLLRPGEGGASSPAALLTVLGKRLDLTGLDVARIEETVDGFAVSASSCGRYSSQRFLFTDLRGVEAPRPDPLPRYLTEKPKARSRGARSRTLDPGRSRTFDTARSRTLPLAVLDGLDSLVEAKVPRISIPPSADSPLRRRLQLA